MAFLALGRTSGTPNKSFPLTTNKLCIENESIIQILNKCSSIFIKITKRQTTIQTMATNRLEQLNIDFSITSILPGGRKTDIVIENNNNNYYIDILVIFNYQENMRYSNSRKIDKYCDLGFHM